MTILQQKLLALGLFIISTLTLSSPAVAAPYAFTPLMFRVPQKHERLGSTKWDRLWVSLEVWEASKVFSWMQMAVFTR